MITAGQFSEALAQNITPSSNSDASATQATTAFANYLQNFSILNEPLTSSILDGFFRRALSFSFWRENKQVLVEQVEKNLNAIAEQRRSPPPSEEWLKSGRTQEFEIQNLTDLKAIVSHYLDEHKSPGDRYRLFSQPGQRLLAIVATASGGVIVRIFNNWVTLRDGKIVPLLNDLILTYNAQLELASGLWHHVEISAHVTCRFRLTQNLASGTILRGYTLQTLESLNGSPVTSNPNLFYTIKRLEQFFINRKTDPLYVELSQLLEQSASLIREGHADAYRFGQNTLKRAQVAYEHIFTEDRLLGLLIRDLTRALEAAN